VSVLNSQRLLKRKREPKREKRENRPETAGAQRQRLEKGTPGPCRISGIYTLPLPKVGEEAFACAKG
jgi:hypothetical protein